MQALEAADATLCAGSRRSCGCHALADAYMESPLKKAPLAGRRKSPQEMQVGLAATVAAFIGIEIKPVKNFMLMRSYMGPHRVLDHCV
jgi:hypothetical protein